MNPCMLHKAVRADGCMICLMSELDGILDLLQALSYGISKEMFDVDFCCVCGNHPSSHANDCALVKAQNELSKRGRGSGNAHDI